MGQVDVILLLLILKEVVTTNPPSNVVTVLAGSQIQVPTSVTGYAEESDDDKDIDDGVSQENIFTPGDLTREGDSYDNNTKVSSTKRWR